jgi:hypothetical protein
VVAGAGVAGGAFEVDAAAVVGAAGAGLGFNIVNQNSIV